MQISALNLIIAAQQARQTTTQRPEPYAQNSAPGKADASRPTASREFVPPPLTADMAPAASSEAVQAQAPTVAPLGSQIDIRV